MHDQFRFILRQHTFNILPNCLNSQRIGQNIYKTLITNHQYEVKSNVSNEVFQSFIDYMVNNEIPDINARNASEFEKLSNEFDYMPSMMKLFKKLNEKLYFSSIKEDQNNFNSKFKRKCDKMVKIVKNYQDVIQFIFEDNSYPDIKSDYLNLVAEEYDRESTLPIIHLYPAQKVEGENGLLYILDDEKKEAGIAGINVYNENVVVPRSIIHNNKEYLITSVVERAFYNSNKIKNFFFSDDSELKLIEKYSFTVSSLEYIKIPPKVAKIDEYAFSSLENIQKIEFSQNCELRIIEKEAFSYSNLKEITIPSHVTTIGRYAFAGSNLEKFDLEVNSELNSISRSAFSGTFIKNLTLPSSIDDLNDGFCVSTNDLTCITIIPCNEQNILLYENNILVGKSNPKSDSFDILHCATRDIENAFIPSFIKRIAPFAFDNCKALKKVEFSADSEFISIGHESFHNSPITSIKFPSCPIEFNDGWCSDLRNLTKIEVSPSNKQMIYLDNKLLLGKSHIESDNYDVLIFARRDIKDVIIPSFVRKIGSRAFEDCTYLRSIVFSDDSQLVSIGDHAFASSSINEILIPSTVKRIGNFAFNYCLKLKKVFFMDDSDLFSIGKYAFNSSSITSIILPPKLSVIGKFALYCDNFQIIEISGSSPINKRAFYFSKDKNNSFVFPTKIRKKLNL
ncbi:hypothetical protein M9Y10_042800 [Tritrichomonas musculus]|uniref:Leucine-rich repeat domain-containing protein n=1 Tax=Tritrichomonas musculus TaxID=1915356 RepID=A0ABR2JXX1_9EUKA